MDYSKIFSVCWNGVCYHEEQLQAVIQSQDVKYYAHILHDKDTLSDGTLKKPHYHFVVQFTRNQRGSYFKRYNTDDMGMVFPKPVNDPEAAYNYLIHDTETAKKDGKYLYAAAERISTFEVFTTEEKEDENAELFDDIAAIIRKDLTWHEMLKSKPKRIHMIANIRAAHNLLRDEAYGILDDDFDERVRKARENFIAKRTKAACDERRTS